MSVTYPLFVFEKDDNSMRLVKSESQILRDLEAIDIQNDEYAFWDVNGAGVSVAVSVGAFKTKLESVKSSPAVFSIREAFTLYAKNLGLPETVIEGTPMDVWSRIQSDLAGRSQRRGFLSRLLSR